MSTHTVSLAGTPAASPLGYFSWTFGQAGRDPYYILVIIYIVLMVALVFVFIFTGEFGLQ